MKNAMQLKAIMKNIGKEKNVPSQVVLQNFMMERVLERISISSYQTKFILKGGMLIASLVGLDSRATMDIDATMKNYALNEKNIRIAFADILSQDVGDEITFRLNKIENIRKDEQYDGFRISVEAIFDTLIVPLKIDLTTGDKITPDAMNYNYKLLLEPRFIEILSYNIETILAEKMETIISRGVLNTRMRDYYDIYILNKLEATKIDYSIYADAIAATSEERESTEEILKRKSVIETIKSSSVMKKRWEDYQREYGYAKELSFGDVLLEVDKLIELI
jgi:predicted nucleotidyltransferase component of viral defense system